MAASGDAVGSGRGGGTYAVVVLHLWAERVREALGGTNAGDLDETSKQRSTAHETLVNCKGPSHLSPIARQQISRVLAVPHTAASFDDAAEAALGALGLALGASGSTQGREGTPQVRLDTVPKSIMEGVAERVLRAGTVELVYSVAKAQWVLNVVRLSEEGPWCWGLVPAAEAQEMNGCVNAVIPVISMDSKTGDDISPAGGAPVSRAFYKMHQVLTQTLKDFPCRWAPGGCGLDLGASPGGWTQALRGGGGDWAPAGGAAMAKVLGIDKGLIATRVRELGGVSHACMDFTTPEAAAAIAAAGPLACIVCDANVHAHDIMSLVLETLTSAVRAGGWAEGEGPGRLLSPSGCFLVVTLKFPYKRGSSIAKRLELMGETLPGQLRQIADLGGGDRDVPYIITHLMANAEGERTLVADIGGSSRYKYT